MAVYQQDEISSPFPCFLTKVYQLNHKQAEAEEEKADFNHLIFALHAALLESGFVSFGSITQNKIDGFRLPTHITFLYYTIPSLILRSISTGGTGDGNRIETVSLQFQIQDKYLNIDAYLPDNSLRLSLCFDKTRFAPSIRFVCCNDEKYVYSAPFLVNISGIHVQLVSEFWKIVKDELALPLLIDLCEMTGLDLPLCFMTLTPDLKLKILEHLRGNDIAKVACVCLELRDLSSSNCLWKKKVEEEFKLCTSEMEVDNWKLKFQSCWMEKWVQFHYLNTLQF